MINIPEETYILVLTLLKCLILSKMFNNTWVLCVFFLDSVVYNLFSVEAKGFSISGAISSQR